jgi:competence protein ComEA
MSRLAWIKAVFTALLLTFTPLAIAADTPADTTQQVSQLDINSADATTIAESLEGIDMVKAREIVSYREMFGRFRSVDELIEVQGIGEATVEKNRHRILIVNN